MSTTTVGRKPTLGEVIEYCTRGDFWQLLLGTIHTRRVVLVISEKAHWEPNWGRCGVHARALEGLRQFIQTEIAARLSTGAMDERPDYYPAFHQAVWRRQGDDDRTWQTESAGIACCRTLSLKPIS